MGFRAGFVFVCPAGLMQPAIRSMVVEMPSHSLLHHLKVDPLLADIHIAEDALVSVRCLSLDGDHLAKHFCRECFLGLAAKVLCGFRAINVLKAYIVLFVALGLGYHRLLTPIS